MLHTTYSIHNTPALLAIVGPTASGKSDLAMKLAKKFGGEIVCADSRTVYKGMDIGTAKPGDGELLQIPHHLLNLVVPDERFTAAQFKQLAVSAINDISSRGKVPILVGGTGLYVDSVLFDYRFPGGDGSEDRGVRSGLSLDELVAKLEELDAEQAVVTDLKNRRRVERAIEVVGLPKSKELKMRPHTLVLGLTVDKKVLQQRIEQRVWKMLDKGLIDEVRTVGEKYGWDNEALRAPAYLAFRDVILGLKTAEEGAAEFARRDINLAKRQMTWFKRNKEIVWLEAEDPKLAAREASQLVGGFLNG